MKTIASTAAFTLLLSSIPTVAQDVPLCYVQTKAGLLLSLEKLCERSPQRFTKPLSDKEQKFLEDLKQSIGNRPESQASIEPQMAIDQAKKICSELEAGTFIDYRQAQNEMIAQYNDPTTQIALSSQSRIIQTIAPKHFCPGFDG